MDKKYLGNTHSVDGSYFLVNDKDAKVRPFKCALDIGLARTSTGARIFGAFKGACDGGLYIPHDEEGKRFPGWSKTEKKYDPVMHKKYIFGGHVADYMKFLANDETKYKTQFNKYIQAGIKADDLEKLYHEVHKQIRKNPQAVIKKKVEGDKKKVKSYKLKKLSAQERKDRAVKKKLTSLSSETKTVEEDTIEDAE